MDRIAAPWVVDPTVVRARRWLERRCEGPECDICGAIRSSDHEPTDPCGIIAALLKLMETNESPTEIVQRRIRKAMDLLIDNVRALRADDYEVEIVAKDEEGRITLTVLVGVFPPREEG